MKDVNNVHLVCRNFHQIANLHVNPKLNFYWETPKKDQESLVKSSRVFKKLEFSYESDDFLRSPEKFQLFEKYLGFTGSHIKNFSIKGVNMDQMVLQKLLDLLPNLESLELSRFGIANLDEPKKIDLKSTNIKCFKMTGFTGLANLLESLHC